MVINHDHLLNNVHMFLKLRNLSTDKNMEYPARGMRTKSSGDVASAHTFSAKMNLQMYGVCRAGFFRTMRAVPV